MKLRIVPGPHEGLPFTELFQLHVPATGLPPVLTTRPVCVDCCMFAENSSCTVTLVPTLVALAGGLAATTVAGVVLALSTV